MRNVYILLRDFSLLAMCVQTPSLCWVQPYLFWERQQATLHTCLTHVLILVEGNSKNHEVTRCTHTPPPVQEETKMERQPLLMLLGWLEHVEFIFLLGCQSKLLRRKGSAKLQKTAVNPYDSPSSHLHLSANRTDKWK